MTGLVPTSDQVVQFEFVAPNNHRANSTERNICTTKNHIISTLASIHITFPLDLWDKLLSLVELSCKLMLNDP
jgi:hypothetical protein